MRKFHIGLILLFSLFLSGCISYIPFTLKHQTDILPEELQNLQFYISQPLILEREILSDEQYVSDKTHTIRDENKQKILQIKIPKHSPGVFCKFEDDKIYVQFEKDEPEETPKIIPFAQIPYSIYDTDEPEKYVYQMSDDDIFYGEEEFRVLYLKKKTRVGKENLDIQVNSANPNTKKHYYIKTLYPILEIRPVQKIYQFERIKKKLPGKQVDDPDILPDSEEKTEKIINKEDEDKEDYENLDEFDFWFFY